MPLILLAEQLFAQLTTCFYRLANFPKLIEYISYTTSYTFYSIVLHNHAFPPHLILRSSLPRTAHPSIERHIFQIPYKPPLVMTPKSRNPQCNNHVHPYETYNDERDP
jgi:hypothetical protein